MWVNPDIYQLCVLQAMKTLWEQNPWKQDQKAPVAIINILRLKSYI